MKLWSILLTIVVFYGVSYGQHHHSSSSKGEPPKSENSKLIDEFGTLPHCDLTGRYDLFFAELSQKPDQQGYVMICQGADVLPANFDSTAAERMFRNHMMFRGFDPSRVTLINGGFREEGSTQLWLVPPDAVPPSPENTIAKPSIPTDKTFLFDRDYLALEEEDQENSEYVLPSVKEELAAERLTWEEEARLERLAAGEEDVEPEANDETAAETEDREEEPSKEDEEAYKFHWLSVSFGKLLATRKDSSGVIIFYADDQRFDIQKIRDLIDEGVRELNESAAVKAGRIEVVFGGYRSSTDVEFWVVPKGSTQPVPTPQERPVEEPEETEDN